MFVAFSCFAFAHSRGSASNSPGSPSTEGELARGIDDITSGTSRRLYACEAHAVSPFTYGRHGSKRPGVST